MAGVDRLLLVHCREEKRKKRKKKLPRTSLLLTHALFAHDNLDLFFAPFACQFLFGVCGCMCMRWFWVLSGRTPHNFYVLVLFTLGTLAIVPVCPLLLAVTCSMSASPAEYRNMTNKLARKLHRDASF